MEYGFDSLFGEGPTPTASTLGLGEEDDMGEMADIDQMSTGLSDMDEMDGDIEWYNNA